MKSISLFLGLLLSFNVISANASQCGGLFDQSSKEYQISQESAAQVLIDIFSMILNAPPKSIVKVYTRTIKYDGIGSLFFMTSVAQAFKERQLQFRFYFEDTSTLSRVHDLFADLSANKVLFLKDSEKLTNATLVVVESKESVSFLEFQGDLASSSLKDSSQKGPIPVKYDGRNMLRASPFIENIEVKKGELPEALKERLAEMEINYVPHRSRWKDTVEDYRQKRDDLDGIMNRGYDLALQLYHKKFGKAPKESLNTMGILSEVIKNDSLD